MNIYVWYSDTSKETGIALAAKMTAELGAEYGVTHGNLPPSGFNGTVLSWGGKFDAKRFKWKNRDIGSLFNDPRVVSDLKSREKMFQVMHDDGTPVIKTVKVAPGDTFDNKKFNLLGKPFVMAKDTGTKARTVNDQKEFATAVKDGCSLVFNSAFCDEYRMRVFVVKGQVVGAQSKNEAADPKKSFLDGVAAEKKFNAKEKQTLKALLDDGYLAPVKKYTGKWKDTAITDAAKNVAKKAAAALNFDFCAVDMTVAVAPCVLNVFTSPGLMDSEKLLSTIANALSTWVISKNRPATELLLDLVAKMKAEQNEEAAQAMLDMLNQVKVDNKALAG